MEDNVMPASFDRRHFLNRGVALGAGVAALSVGGSTLLTACGSSSSSSKPAASGGATDLGQLVFQLSWIKNVEFAGSYFADKNGYYKKAGFSSVSLLSGGPSVSQDAVVASGKALVAVSTPDISAAAILKGAESVLLGAMYQKNPFCVMSLAKKPINNPTEMIGKKIGVQAINQGVFNAFLQANGLKASQMTVVPVQFDPTPLANGQVDGWFSFITNEPNLLKEKGIDTATFLLNDYKYPLVSEVYVALKKTVDEKRDALKAFLKADIMGWHDALKDPAGGATLAASTYGKGLGLTVDEQTLESKAQNALILTDRTKTDGIATMTQDMIDENINTLGLGGIKITADKLFDLSVLEEVYKENPDLKTV
jgi:ABC-type nitrate/sulfonate/bicarbonate transport system substrate-binding protein